MSERTMRFLSDWRNARSPQERTEAAFKVAASLETDVLGGSLGRACDGEET